MSHPTTYSRTVDEADSDLEFKLRRSIDLIEKEKAMAKKKAETKERASVSRERRLALALRAVLDATMDASVDAEQAPEIKEVFTGALTTLTDLGYSTLEGIPKRVARLNAELKAAVESGDGKEIARLGLELERAKSGKEARVVQEAGDGN